MTRQSQLRRGDMPNSQLDMSRPALEVQLQKTKLCSYHLRSVCMHGSACRFAHGPEELMEHPDLSKTTMCPDLGKCIKSDCKYAHHKDEIRETNFCYKTTQCTWYASGRCRNGSQCRFAHGEENRRTPVDEAMAQEKAGGDRKKENEQQQPEQQQSSKAGGNRTGKKDKEKQQQQQEPQQPQRAKEPMLIQQQSQQHNQHHQQRFSEPMFIQANTVQPTANQVQPSQIYLPFPPGFSMGQQAMQYSMGYPTCLSPELTGACNVAPTMQGTDYDALSCRAAVPPHLLPESASELNKVKMLKKHIKLLRQQVKQLQDTMDQKLRSDSGQSTLSGTTSAVWSSSSNEVSGHSTLSGATSAVDSSSSNDDPRNERQPLRRTEPKRVRS